VATSIEIGALNPFALLQPDYISANPEKPLTYSELDAYAAEILPLQPQRSPLQRRVGELILCASEVSHAITLETYNRGAQRFNDISNELYPPASPREIAETIQEERKNLQPIIDDPDADQTALGCIVNFLDSLSDRLDGTAAIPKYSLEERLAARRALHEYLQERFSWMIGLASDKDWLTPKEMEQLYKDCFATLAVQEPPGLPRRLSWTDWDAEIEPDSRIQRTWSPDHTIFVAGKIPYVNHDVALALLFHELLTHGLRGINGERNDIPMQDNFGRLEEGLGRYNGLVGAHFIKPSALYASLFISVAQRGIIDDKDPYTRKELAEVAYAVERVYRQADSRLGDPSDLQNIRTTANTWTNRLYKGGRGDATIGSIEPIFSHDVMYHRGFTQVDMLFAAALREGSENAVGKLWEALEQAHFNPFDRQHQSDLATLGRLSLVKYAFDLADHARF
jgi:hypothetical protein